MTEPATEQPGAEQPGPEQPGPEQAVASAPAKKAAKRPILRRLLSSVLVFEAIILVLAIPVAVTIEHLHHGVAFGVGGVLAVIAVLLAGVIGRRRWALVAGTVLQFVIVAAGFEVGALYVLGIVFCVLWFGGIYLADKLEQPNPR
ncbi:MAG TPA: DUF4233 domain-containing protein [Streptosporangiaceae bacterium]|jgi:hypothetical protein